MGRVALLWQRVEQRLSRSLRTRLLALALLPLVVGFPALLLLLASWGGATFHELLVFKVRSDLAVASTYFERVQGDLGRSIEALASSEALASARRSRQPPPLDKLLQARAQALGLDYLLLVDTQRRVLASSLPRGVEVRYPAGAVLGTALSGYSAVSLDVFSAAQLQQLAPALAARAQVRAQGLDGSHGGVIASDGLLLHAAAALPGQRLALVGGLLLNGNTAFVDRIQHLVYPAGSLPAHSRGSTTLFLHDVRITTTVALPRGGRALGTRVSDEVAGQVLGDGLLWLDRAYVVRDWYVSGYRPLLDSRGQRIGMLYVGFLEQPFVLAKWLALAVLFFLFAVAMAAAAWVSWRVARSVIAPVERLRRTMDAVAAGQLDARVGPLPLDDELALLARHFDALLARIQQQNQALTRWAADLDDKVAARTRELAAANQTLLTAQQQLFKSEKLAAIGQLAAGIAHEVNNPVAVIQGNVDLMQELLGEAAAPLGAEFRLIREQVQRIRLIVAKLLQYARPSDYAGYLQQVLPHEVCQDSLLLVGHQLGRGNVVVRTDWQAQGRLLVNRFELQQVLINLILNALQAMPEGGVLSLATRDGRDGGSEGVVLSVCDSGAGIADGDLARLFTPFFTRKAEGSGLGLWVCQGLIEAYGGRIDAANLETGGAVFRVWLPCEPVVVAAG